MKNFLKILLIGVFAITTLTGCGDDVSIYNKNTETVFYKELAPLLTKQEKLLLEPIFMKWVELTDRNSIHRDGLRYITMTRNMGSYTKEIPFCDVVDSFIKQTNDKEYNWNVNYLKVSVLSQWKRMTGSSLKDSCKYEGIEDNEIFRESSIIPTPEQTNQQIIDDTVTIKEETLLSPAKVRELKTSIGECNIAKTKLIMLTDNNRYLTEKDYDVVTKLILDCEYDGLRNEMNK